MTVRSGPFYTGFLMTRRIPDSLPLADIMVKRSRDLGFWGNIGRCIRQFHDHGVVHADLNARNILVDYKDRVYLIDFDRARIAGGSPPAFAGNMKRLRRSLDKLWPEPLESQLDACWEALEAAYENGGGG